MPKLGVFTFIEGPPGGHVSLAPPPHRRLGAGSAALAAAMESLPDKKRAKHEPPTPREQFERTMRVFEGAIADVLTTGTNVSALAASTRTLLIQGSGGAGKTHLLCDAVRQRTAV